MHRVTPNATLHATLYFLLLIIFVIACLMIVPAFSVSFFVSPLVTQTFKQGWGCHPASRGLTPRPRGKALRRVTKTPFARHYNHVLAVFGRKHRRGDSCLVNNIAENLVLIFYAEFLRLYDFGFERKQQHRIIARTLRPHPIAPGIQLCAHGLDVLPQRHQNVRLLLQQ